MKKIQQNILIALLFLAVAIVPLVVQVEYVRRTQSEQVLFGGEEYRVDVFAYAKAKLFIIISVLITLVGLNTLADKLVKGRSIDFKGFIKKPQNIALCVYIVTVLLSFLFSPYKDVALGGSTERYEGFFVVLGYCLIFYTAMSQINTLKNANIVLYGVLFSALVIGVIGTLQLLGNDIFAWESFQNIILNKIRSNPEAPPLEEFGPVFFKIVYGTHYNPNCAGMYGAMLSLLTLSLAILLPVKSILKYVAIALTPLTVTTLVGSSSLGGMVGALVGVVAFIFIAIVYLVKNATFIEILKKRLLFILLGVVAVIIGFVVVVQIPIIKDKVTTYVERITTTIKSVKENINDKDYPLYNYISIDGSIIEINTAKGVVYISHDAENAETVLLDSDKSILEPTEVIASERTGGDTRKYSVPQMGTVSLEVFDNVVTFEYVGFFPFGIKPDGSFTAVTKRGNAFDINEPIPTVGFKNVQTFANARGHIWSRSIPVILKNLIIGKGPDTFIFAYPQHDLVGKANAFRDTLILVDKPHNIYLQYAINTGFISLLAIITIFVTYILTTVKSLVKHGRECSAHIAALRMSIFASVCAYLVAGIATDSVVSIAPVFWCLLGLGFAVNNINDKTIRRI